MIRIFGVDIDGPDIAIILIAAVLAVTIMFGLAVAWLL